MVVGGTNSEIVMILRFAKGSRYEIFIFLRVVGGPIYEILMLQNKILRFLEPSRSRSEMVVELPLTIVKGTVRSRSRYEIH